MFGRHLTHVGSVAVEGCPVILSSGSFRVHIPVNEFWSCGRCVAILGVINTADSVRVVYKRQKEKLSKCGAKGRGGRMCVWTRVF